MKFFLIILASTFLLCAAWTHRFTKLTSVSNQFYIKGKGKMIIPQSTWGAKITRSNFALPVTYGSEDEVYNLWCEAYVRYLREQVDSLEEKCQTIIDATQFQETFEAWIDEYVKTINLGPETDLMKKLTELRAKAADANFRYSVQLPLFALQEVFPKLRSLDSATTVKLLDPQILAAVNLLYLQPVVELAFGRNVVFSELVIDEAPRVSTSPVKSDPYLSIEVVRFEVNLPISQEVVDQACSKNARILALFSHTAAVMKPGARGDLVGILMVPQRRVPEDVDGDGEPYQVRRLNEMIQSSIANGYTLANPAPGFELKLRVEEVDIGIEELPSFE